MTREMYIGKAIKDMIASDITISFTRRKNNSKLASSYFDPLMGPSYTAPPKFTLNYFDNDFVNIFEYFIHEYCHFKQWKEQSEVFKNGQANWLLFDLFLNNKFDRFTKAQLLTIQKLELDCDSKVLEEVRKYNLPIDTRKYAKESNSYIYSYNIIYELRKFSEIVDFTDKELLKYMPSRQISADKIQTRIPKYDKIYTQLLNN